MATFPKFISNFSFALSGALGGFLLVSSCGGSGGQLSSCPKNTPACLSCHTQAEIGQVLSDENAGPREWMSQAGSGLTRAVPFIPLETEEYVLEWPHRGRHPEYKSSDCCACHPADNSGLGHSSKTYPDPEDCQGRCHVWLKPAINSSGFAILGGEAPSYSGSAEPEALLSAAENAHSRVCREGYQRPEGISDRIKVGQLSPGCRGCHNHFFPRHGAVSVCTDCHAFGDPAGGTGHLNHAAYISARQNELNPGAAGGEVCVYCHGFSAGADSFSSAACYNCHLSGHQPLNPEGNAHFWR
ncbi:MAG: hypothetical protein NT009_12500 [Proteobacteria bacterium]|nr:hypothetical protein [Pseudomonadota bacterium]